MNWKAVGLGSGKTYATGTHADCIRAIGEGEHVEAIRVMREGEYIRTEDEQLEAIEEKMRQTKEKKHIQLEIKKAALAEERERKRIAAEQEEIRKENIRLASVARVQAMQEAARIAEKEQRQAEPKEKYINPHAWTPEQDAYLKTNIREPNKKLIEAFKERFGREFTNGAINNRKYMLRKKYGIPAMRSKANWKPDEDEFLIANYHRMTAEAIGDYLGGRKKAAVWNRAEKLKDAGLMTDERYDKRMDYWIPEERVEKMDTIKTIKPEKGDKTAKHMIICKQLNQTYQEKNADYGDSFSETYQKLGIISAVTRISDKTNRLISLAGKSEAERLVKDETLRDTLIDLAGYAVLTLLEMEEAK